MSGKKLEITGPMESTFASLTDDDTNNSSHLWSASSSGEVHVPGINTVGNWSEDTFIAVNSTQNQSSVSVLNFGHLHVNVTTVYWIGGSNGILFTNGTLRAWISTGESSFTQEGPDGIEAQGNYTFVVNSILNTENPEHLVWTTGTIEALNVQNISVYWANNIKGELNPHNSTGTWNSTTTGAVLPTSGPSDLFNNPITSFLLKTFVESANVPLGLVQDNTAHLNWTVHTKGALKSEGDNTVDWSRQNNVSVRVNNHTNSWIVSSNGSTTVSQITHNLFRGIETRNEEPAEPMHSVWFEVSQPVNYFTAPLKQTKGKTVPNGTIQTSGTVQLPDIVGNSAEETN